MIDLDAQLRTPAARLLVIAPHPDDESLATGGLLQRAQARGAAVKIVLLTDGDNNPWPQRWLEKRWHIGPNERKRWGRRRRAEAHAALAALGVAEQSVTCLGWPDLGVTARLMDDTTSAVAALAKLIGEFAPTVLVVPSLGDGHPDHSAAHVLVRLALARLGDLPTPALLSYLIHGRAADGESVRVRLTSSELAAKRAAVLSYQTQVSLSRGRLLAQVAAVETFQVDGAAAGMAATAPWQAPAWLRWRNEWQVVAGEQTWRQQAQPIHRAGDLLQTVLAGAPKSCANEAAVYVKLHTRLRSPWIFDHWGWRCLRSAQTLTAGDDSAKLDPHELLMAR